MSMLEYLQKNYLDAAPKIKKKRKTKNDSSKIKIIDFSEGDWKTPVAVDDEDVLIDELPTVAETVDERPAELVETEKYQTSASWKPLGAKSIEKPESKYKRHKKSPNPRKRQYSSDASPPRTQHDSSDASPPRKRHDSSDASPPRKRHDLSDASPSRKRHDSSDASPPRKRHDSSDASPPRKRHDSRDASPPRKRHDSSDASPPRKGRNSADDQPSHEKDPKSAISVSDTIYRDRATGKKKEKNKELDAKQKLIQDKVAKWKTGAAQARRQNEAAEEAVHEMGKGFTRSTGDADLEKYLKDQTHEDDPMAEYLSKKKAKREKKVEYPKYKGAWPANRFNIPPGYRWDGVDRSNGFEKKYFESVNNRKAFAIEAHKWSVENM